MCVCAKIDTFSQISDTSEHVWRICVWIASILRSINHVESATWWASRFTPSFIPLNSSNRLFTVLSRNFDHVFCVSYRFAYSPFVWNDYFHFCLQCRRYAYLCGMVCGFMIVGTITTKKTTFISDYWTWRKGERERERDKKGQRDEKSLLCSFASTPSYSRHCSRHFISFSVHALNFIKPLSQGRYGMITQCRHR